MSEPGIQKRESNKPFLTGDKKMHITDENSNPNLDDLLSKVELNKVPDAHFRIRKSEIDDAKRVDFDSLQKKWTEQRRQEQKDKMNLEIEAETARVRAEILNKYKAEESAEAKKRAAYLKLAQAISKLEY